MGNDKELKTLRQLDQIFFVQFPFFFPYGIKEDELTLNT